jgi:hypothetical protein
MKERLVRGTNVENVVRVLRAGENEHRLPELGQWEKDLLKKRVSRSTWYSLAVFESLLQVAHRYVFDGSEMAAQGMGRTFARGMIDEERDALIVVGDPLEALGRMHARWRDLFNFGEISVASLEPSEGKKRCRVRLTGYPDMSACHGHCIIGWSMELAEQSGAQALIMRIEERPWMHNSVLTYQLDWTSGT